MKIKHHNEDWVLSYHSDGQGGDLGNILSTIRDTQWRLIAEIKQHRSCPGNDITRYHNALLMAESPRMFRLLLQVRGVVDDALTAEIDDVIRKVTEEEENG